MWTMCFTITPEVVLNTRLPQADKHLGSMGGPMAVPDANNADVNLLATPILEADFMLSWCYS